ncbi:acyltransferase family protein [Allosphingosinicella sp.]|uniref:acyltransferase family protein n=1 Tax=Allosphingosinicella sp. TaxID=2823234 RepID=UPI0037850B0E
MATAPEPRADLPALTGIRGVAAWFVVLYHVRLGAVSALPPPVVAVLSKGYLAVDLFFMLSGFVLWLNYAGRLRGGGIGEAATFLARRIARIWPLHVVMLAGAVAFVLATAAAGRPPSDHYPWGELPLHLALMQNWGLTSALSWNDPAWSISCEFAAYLLFPLLAVAADWRKLGTTALCAFLLLLAGALCAIMWAGSATSLGVDIPHFGLPRALIEFTMGTILCALWTQVREKPRALAGALGALAAFLTAWAAGVPETLAVPLAFAALLLVVALTAASPRNPLGWRPIHYLGEISYSTYLGHFLFFIAFKLAFVTDGTNVPLPLIGLFLVMMLAASMTLYHLVEKPAQRGLNRAFDRLLRKRRRGEPSPAGQ